MESESRMRATDQAGPTLFDPPPRSIPIATIAHPVHIPDPAFADESAEGDGRKPGVACRPDQRPAAQTSPGPGRPSGKAKRAAADRRSQTSARTRPQAAQPLTAELMAARQREISVSEFFAKNRHLLGFDNKRKALLTTVKEAVDNSLDACEEAHLLPEILVRIDQLAEDRFRVMVRDNGPGIVRSQIPSIFGKLLYGSKFHRLKMARGQQGIGISAAGMYGMLTTGRSVRIISRTDAKRPAHYFELQIDTAKNRPDVIREEEIDVPWERGTEVTIELVATYVRGRQSVDEYLEQTAIANPHARILYRAPTGEHREFPRATEELPAEPREIQPHPHGIELGVLMKMLKEARPQRRGERAPTLTGFLQRSFCRVTPRVAAEICAQAGLDPKARATQVGTHEVERLYQAMQSVKIVAPPTDCLTPIGVRNLLAGLLKEVKAEFYTACTRDPAVYRGNPFLVEVGLAYGGNLPTEEPTRLIRFANRVPLLYQQSACAAYKAVLDVDWRNYGLSQPSGGLPIGPLVIMVHLASVWVPFTSESKEAIADYDEIRRETKLAMQECGRKLAAYLRRRRRQRLEADRRSIFSRYIPDVADALANLSGENRQKLMQRLEQIARRRTAQADVELDEEGRAVRRPVDELPDDGSVVVVEENRSQPAASELFAQDPQLVGR